MRNALRKRGVAYEESHHRPVFTAQQVAAEEHISGHRLAKVVVVMADGRPIELVLPATRRVMLERVREALGAREVRFASEQEMERTFPECEIGAVPPLDNWPGIPVVMDPTMMVEGDIIMQAGTHEDTVRMRYDDWFRMVRPRIASFADVPMEVH
jgi:Ala-tRNA(Pro) deacylase